jgi:hypothetical protein
MGVILPKRARSADKSMELYFNVCEQLHCEQDAVRIPAKEATASKTRDLFLHDY